MAMISGTVSKINYADRSGRRVYSVNVDGQWYGGFWNDRPNCNEGDSVEFEATQNGRFWNANPPTLRVVSSQPAAPTGNSSAAGAASSNSGGDSRQNSIVYQSSRGDAIELLKVLLEQDLVSLPTKKADKMGAVLNLVDELTDDFAYKALSPEIMSPDERLQQEVMDDAGSGVEE